MNESFIIFLNSLMNIFVEGRLIQHLKNKVETLSTHSVLSSQLKNSKYFL